MQPPFPERFGRWALVAGASEGLGAAFADALAQRGCNLVTIARRADLLERDAARLREQHRVEVRTLAADLADPTWIDRVRALAGELELGVAVYNAAYSVIGNLLDRSLDDATRAIAVNVTGPMQLVHAVAPAMVARERGAIVLMASLAGFQGSPRIAAYAASKAYTIVLGESLWAELRPNGVDVLVSAAGAIRTPGYKATSKKDAPGTLDPERVVAITLAAIGKRPLVVPGGTNKLARVVLGRLLTRRAAIGIMQKNTRDLT